MNIALHIPVWLLWCIGVPLVVVILILAAFGFWIAKDLSKGGYV